MKHLKSIIAVFAMVAAVVSVQAADQTVNFNVADINLLEISGPVTLDITAPANAGDAPVGDSDSTTSYAISTNAQSGSEKKITVVLDSAMPTGLTLQLSAAAPTNGTGAGTVTVSDSAVDAVNGIFASDDTGVVLTWSLSATIDAAPGSGQSRTATFTLTDDI